MSHRRRAVETDSGSENDSVTDSDTAEEIDDIQENTPDRVTVDHSSTNGLPVQSPEIPSASKKPTRHTGKSVDPSEVPKVGIFYLHDERSKGSRRVPNSKRVVENSGKWVHDKFDPSDVHDDSRVDRKSRGSALVQKRSQKSRELQRASSKSDSLQSNSDQTIPGGILEAKLASDHSPLDSRRRRREHSRRQRTASSNPASDNTKTKDFEGQQMKQGGPIALQHESSTSHDNDQSAVMLKVDQASVVSIEKICESESVVVVVAEPGGDAHISLATGIDLQVQASPERAPVADNNGTQISRAIESILSPQSHTSLRAVAKAFTPSLPLRGRDPDTSSRKPRPNFRRHDDSQQGIDYFQDSASSAFHPATGVIDPTMMQVPVPLIMHMALPMTTAFPSDASMAPSYINSSASNYSYIPYGYAQHTSASVPMSYAVSPHSGILEASQGPEWYHDSAPPNTYGGSSPWYPSSKISHSPEKSFYATPSSNHPLSLDANAKEFNPHFSK